MVQQRLSTNRFVICVIAFTAVVAFVALWHPNTVFKKDTDTVLEKECICRKISSFACILDPSSEHECKHDGCESGICYIGQFDRGGSPEFYEGRSSAETIPSRFTILDTGYSLMIKTGQEQWSYGLYSYALLVTDNDRSAKFLSDVFGVSAIPSVKDTTTQRSLSNIFYIPIREDKWDDYIHASSKLNGHSLATTSLDYAKNFYDYKMANSLLNHLCDPPAEEIKTVCEGDRSRGPYIFTYARPASTLTPVPPPLLFIDLSDVHERAFPEIIAAFRAQVKREDFSDRAKIDTLRLKLLSIILTAADVTGPVQKAMADIVHSASGLSEKDKK